MRGLGGWDRKIVHGLELKRGILASLLSPPFQGIGMGVLQSVSVVFFYLVLNAGPFVRNSLKFSASRIIDNSPDPSGNGHSDFVLH